MNSFSEFVKEHGSETAALAASFKSFPINGEFRELKLFVNTHSFGDELNLELEQLHDQYWLKEGGEDG